MSQPHPVLINLPQPSSNPDTPSEIPGTPTSTTTSLSALSTTAIKDGHRGHALPTMGNRSGHQQHASQNSLDAERADRISRLAGLSSVSQLRSPPNAGSQAAANINNNQQTTPTSAGFPQNAAQAVAPHILGVPAYFDSNGQPVAVTKMSTSGTASATESHGVEGEGSLTKWLYHQDIDMMSTATDFGRETEVDSTSGYVGTAHTEQTDMDVDEDNMTNRSMGQFEQDDNMSDDGSASLVGFGEGANSTISGPIYVRRPLPGGMERRSSGFSDGAAVASRRERTEREDTAAVVERRDARIIDGVSSDGAHGAHVAADDEAFVDTTNSGPVPVTGSFQPGINKRVMRERGLEYGQRPGGSPLASPSKRLAFEDQK
ncbi:hypothetical protein M406DRAFT_347008 [Cryphonectria parasitica EP155]|uniref:Uncharacterized protein n=1 Tax=Cryphonectria parasitica (strain ATCC 38755 / EP155) TaxID=660469 RepID=A0A9P5CMI1_CRYP1|nr:uncharacterized protein M406DRAFT_347008 [Cryphonectria parasitica EP155]KAF3763116.1 hypothetical protein M406DRAFT_347008 [Cryphonectria parasitica EP155]